MSTERLAALAREHQLLVAAIAAGLVMRIVFWAVTGREWEDAVITITHARNAVDGVGLTHHAGEGHVHGFSSALSVLIPLPGELIAEGGGMTALRLASLLAFVATAIYAYRICVELELGPWPTGFVLAYLAFDQNQIFYGMAGMETQVAVAVLLAGVLDVMRAEYSKAGIALALALLARPDFVLWVGPAYLFLFLRDRRETLTAGLLSLAVLAPWLIFTTAYYGSPVPNTITAKSLRYPLDFPGLGSGPSSWWDFVSDKISSHDALWKHATPFLENGFVVDTPFPELILKLAVGCLLALALLGAITTWRRRMFRPAILFAGLYVVYVVFYLPEIYYEWYYPPPLAVIAILAGCGLQRIGTLGFRLAPAVAAALASYLAIAYAIHMPYSFPLEDRIQSKIEERVRIPMSRYLGEVVQPGETVSSESAGYVGYYSRTKLYDYPGLTSPTAVDAMRELEPDERTFPGLIDSLRPDWIVVRPFELQVLALFYPNAAAEYVPTARFMVPLARSGLEQSGLSMTSVDRDFIVMRRR